MQVAVLLGIAFAIGAVAFALQNNVPVTVTFFIWRFDSALAMVVLLALAAGALVVALLSTPTVLRLQWKAASQQRRIQALEQANEELEKRLHARDNPGAPTPAGEPSPLERMAPRRP